MKFFIPPNSAFLGCVRVFLARQGFSITLDDKEADALCLTGGADISPLLYGQRVIKGTFPNISRDQEEIRWVNKFVNRPKFGICRGGQLLNALSNGSMWQDVNNHHGDHKAMDLISGTVLTVTSVHHQEMIPPEDADILLVSSQSTKKKNSLEERHFVLSGGLEHEPQDIEGFYVDRTKSLCIQGHPEWGNQQFKDLCGTYIRTFLQ